MSYQAYQKVQNATETSSQTEYRLFVQVTNALVAAHERGTRDSQMMDALDWNRRMWSVFSADCGAKGNELPDQLRAGIISLSIWVSKHSSLVMRGVDSIEALIDVNKMIMEGLAEQAKLQQAQGSASAPQQHGKPLNAVL